MLYNIGGLYLFVLYYGLFALRFLKANIYYKVKFINNLIFKIIYFDIIISNLKENGWSLSNIYSEEEY